MNENSLLHTKWECKYHVVSAPEFRRKVICGQIREDIGKIIRELCTRKEVEIHEAHACIDHVHMLVFIPPKLSVAQFVGYLKGKSTLMIFERHANLKYRYGTGCFGAKGITSAQSDGIKSNRAVYQKSRTGGHDAGTAPTQGVCRPF